GTADRAAQRCESGAAFENPSWSESDPPNRSHAALSRPRIRRLSRAHKRLLRGPGKIFLLRNPSLRSHGRAADLAANRCSSRRGRVRRGAHVFANDQSFSGSYFFVRTSAE